MGDLPAGPRQTAFDWAPYAETFVVLAEPSWKSALTARRVARIARSRGGVEALFVASKVRGPDDVQRVERMLGEPVLAWLPADPAVEEADRRGVALIDYAPDSSVVRAAAGLAAQLAKR